MTALYVVLALFLVFAIARIVNRWRRWTEDQKELRAVAKWQDAPLDSACLSFDEIREYACEPKLPKDMQAHLNRCKRCQELLGAAAELHRQRST